MARHTKPIEIKTDDETNRDRGKAFFITEMDAFQADDWGKRLLLAFGKVNLNSQIIGDIENAGMMGVASLGFHVLGSLKYEDLKPLLNELMACVQYIPDPHGRPDFRRGINMGGAVDIEEPSTISFLQMEAFNLHVNFSKLVAGLKSKLLAAMASMKALQNT